LQIIDFRFQIRKLKVIKPIEGIADFRVSVFRLTITDLDFRFRSESCEGNLQFNPLQNNLNSEV
jgi:hypothetical protein